VTVDLSLPVSGRAPGKPTTKPVSAAGPVLSGCSLDDWFREPEDLVE
jgi:hypothetical protein